MHSFRPWRLVFAMLATPVLAPYLATVVVLPAAAQQPPAAAAPAAVPAETPAKPAAKPKPKPKPATAAPAPEAATPAPAKPAVPAVAAAGGVQPRLLGQYGDWGAYTAAPAGKRVCFAISKPTVSQTNPPNRPRNPAYMFITTRPADKVANEVSVVIGYPFKSGSEASADVGSASFALYTQQDGAWIKNAAEEAHLVEAMRAGQSLVVKGVSAKGTQSTDSFNLKGLSQALDRVAQECK